MISFHPTMKKKIVETRRRRESRAAPSPPSKKLTDGVRARPPTDITLRTSCSTFWECKRRISTQMTCKVTNSLFLFASDKHLFFRTTMLPWNFFITAEDYWQYKFRNLSTNNTEILTPRQIQFQPDLAMCSAIPTTIFLILNAFYSHK